MEQLVERGDDVNVVDRLSRLTDLLHFAAGQGSTSVCELLLKSGANICAKDENGDQALHCAARNNEAVVCELLVAHGADVAAVNKKGQTPLGAAAGATEVGRWWWRPHEYVATCRLLLTNEIVNVADCDGNYPLHMACSRSNIATVQLLMDHGADTNVVNKLGQTLLHTAAGGKEDCPELCEVLLKHDAKIDVVDKDGNQPLHVACKRSFTETVKLMVSHGADTNAVNKHGQTPLHIVTGGDEDCPELCEVLFKHDAKIGAVDKYGNQPLHLACQQNHVETGNLFVSYGADVGAVNSNGHSPLYLLSWSVKGGVNSEEDSALHIVARHGMVTTVQLLVDCGADVNAVNKHGQTPLHIVASEKKDCPELCEILLKHDAKINTVDEDGNQPLHLACQQNHVETGNVFISYGADVSAVNSNGHSPLHLLSTSVRHSKSGVNSEEESILHIAARYGMVTTVQLLVSCGADVNAVNKHGQTPLHVVASREKDCPELYKILLRCGDAKINAVDGDGNQPLHLTCQQCYTETVQVMVSHGADTNAVNKHGQTPLHIVASRKKDCPELCEILLEHDAKSNTVNRNGNQPLHLACQQYHSKTVELMVSYGADVNVVNKHGQTPLHIVASRKKDCPELCEILLKHDAKTGAVDEDGNPPLHLACQQCYTETVQVMVSHGADTNAVNKHGQTPLHIVASRKKDCPELCEILLKHDAKTGAVDEDGNPPLHLACQQSHVETGNVFISYGADVSAVNSNGHSPLHLLSTSVRHSKSGVNSEEESILHRAARYGMVTTVQLLVSCGADVNAVNKHGQTPLHVVTSREKDCPELYEILLRCGDAKINAVDGDGNQPLHLTCQQCYTETVQVMVSHGADTNAVNKHGQGPLHIVASRKKDCPELCEILLKHGAKTGAVDEDGNLPLHLACQQCYTETVQVMVSHGADTNAVNKHGQGPLHIVASRKKDCPELCEILLRHDAKTGAVDEDGNPPLHLACQQCYTETVQVMVSHGADTNAVNKHGQGPLHIVASRKKDCPELCEILLRHDAKTGAVDEDGNPPLHLACQQCYTETVQVMVSHGADTNAVNKHGQTPLHIVASRRKDCPELCEILLKHDAKTGAVDEDGNQPLHLACQQCYTETVQVMVSHGADTNAVNKHRQTPLHIVASRKKDCPELCEILLKHDAKTGAVDEDGNPPLHLACQQCYTETVQVIVSHGTDTNAVNKHGQTPLHIVASRKKDCPELCEILLKHDAKTGAVDEDGNPPLHLACQQNHVRTGNVFISYGADVSAVNSNGHSPLHLLSTSVRHSKSGVNSEEESILHRAARYGMVTTVRLLVSCGADVNVVNKHGQTPLHVVASREKDCPELYEILLRCGDAKINAVDGDGNQPLHLTCQQCYTETVQVMVSHGADTNAVNKHGQTPLHIVASRKKDCPELCEILLKHDAKTGAVDEDGNPPLHLACQQCYTETVQVIVSHGADTNAVNKHGQTPLHIVASRKKDCPELCEILLKHDAKTGAVDEDGNPPLHLACQQCYTETVQVMVSHGADTNAVNKHGQTPLHIAASRKKDCPELCEILLKHDAKTGAVDEDGNLPLHLACQQCYTETVQVMVSHEADTNAVNKHGQRPLHVVSSGKKDCSELCEILLKHGAKTNEEDEDGNQPLHLMCEAGQTLTIKALLGCNANVSARNNHGQTCLHNMASSRRDCPELCLLFIGMGAEVNAVDGNRDTSLQIALQKGNIKTSEVLLANGADGKVLNRRGETVLHLLCKSGVDRHELCEDLISRGVSPHLADREGNLPLHIAFKNKLPKTSWLLFKQLSDSAFDDLQKMNIQNRDINCLLWSAVNVCDASSCHKLLDLGADPNLLNCINQLPDLNLRSATRVSLLHIAVYSNSSELCCLLLDHGATVNVSMLTDKSTSALDQAQPLHLAVKLGFIDVCHVLLERGADVNAEMKKRNTPLHLAIRENRGDIVQLLLTYGAIADNVKIGGVPALERSATRGSRSVASLLHDSGEQHYLMFLAQLTLFSLFIETFPDEIVSQGVTALQIYASSCSEETAVTVFLRVDVVGRDGAGKTSLTKSLTLQEFDPHEPSTRAVVVGPKCQIVVKEACDWTTCLTSKHYRDMYDKNVTAIVADKLDTPAVKDRYLMKKQGYKHSHMARKYADTSTRRRAIKTSSSLVAKDVQQRHDESDSSAIMYITEFQKTKPDFQSDSSSPVATPVSLDVPFSRCTMSPASAPSITAAPKPQSSMEAAHQLALSKLITLNDEEEETSGTDSVFNSDAEVTEEESIVTMSKGSKLTRKTAATEPPAAVRGQQSTRVKRKKEAKTKARKYRKRKTQATAPMHWKKRVSKFLRDKESLKKAQNEMMATVLDYAGQHVFYATHHLCLSKAGFYYVVFDASQPLDGRSPIVFRVRKGEIVQIRQADDETNFDRLLEWMSAIHIMEPDHSLRIMLFDEVGIASPAMFLVGTHADKLKEQPGLLERQEELLKQKLEGTVLAKHIIWASKDKMCFYVDNTLTDPQEGIVDPQVRLLRQMTEEVARKVAQHHKLPVTWLKFEQEVRDVKILDKTKKTASVEYLLCLAKEAAGIKTKEELEVLLHYLSNRAVVLYHPKALKHGEEEVVLDVEWLISQLEKVVTIHTDVPPKFKNDVTRTVQRGIMTASLITHLLSESGSSQSLIISLMNHFDLLCQYAGFEGQELHKADDSQDFLSLDGSEEDSSLDDVPTTENSDYFIPCLLEKASLLESQQIDGTLKTVPLLLSSAPLRIPRPLFYRVLTHLCKRFRRLPVLCSNVGYFHIYPDHRLEFSLNRYSFQFAILSETQMSPRSDVCACARDYIVHTVEKLKLQGMAGLHLQIGFELTGACASVPGVSDDDDFVSLDAFPDQRRQLYNSKNRQIDIPHELLMWYPQLEQKAGIFLIIPISV